jgi:hypothetical protein
MLMNWGHPLRLAMDWYSMNCHANMLLAPMSNGQTGSISFNRSDYPFRYDDSHRTLPDWMISFKAHIVSSKGVFSSAR